MSHGLMPSRRGPGKHAARRARRGWMTALSLVTTALLALGGTATALTFHAPPAQAAPSAGLTIKKTVDTAEVRPGDQAVFTIRAGCSSETTSCMNAVVTDAIPAPFVVEDVSVVGDASTVAVETSGEGNRSVRVSFSEVHENGTTGLKDGSDRTITIIVRLPQSADPSLNGSVITNTAVHEADNATPRDSSASVTLVVPVTPAAALTKEWNRESIIAGSAETLSFTLGDIRNASNIPASSIEIVDPVAGTTPFESVRFTGFGDVRFPTGADRIQVIAVLASGEEQAGPVAATAALPDGVNADDVRGFRVVFSAASGDAALVVGGEAGSMEIQTALRPGTTGGTAIRNEAQATVGTPQGDSAPAIADDVLAVTDVDHAVRGSKRISPRTVAAGAPALVELGATNRSNVDLAHLSITEPAPGTPNPFLGEDGRMTVTSFADTAWPAGAESATATIDGTRYPLSADNGRIVWPTGVLPSSSLTVDFTGTFAPGVGVHASFTVTGTAGAGETTAIPNTIDVSGTTTAGTPVDPDRATDTLAIVAAHTEVDARKRMNPSHIHGTAGEQFSATIMGTLNPDTSNVSAPSIGLVDEFTPEWQEAFTATAVQLSPPEGATVSVWALVAGTWTAVVSDIEVSGSVGLPDGTAGVRVVHSHADGFAPGTSVAADITFRVRADLDRGTAWNFRNVVGPYGADGGRTGEASVTVDHEISVDGSKTWSPDLLTIRPQDSQPRSILSLRGTNTSPLPVHTLTITDPVGGTTPFEYLDIVGLRALQLPDGVTAEDGVRLTLAVAGGSDIVLEGDAAVNPRLSPEQLADVTGITVQFGTLSGRARIVSGANAGVHLDVVLRETTRTGGLPVVDALVTSGDDPTMFVLNNTATVTVERAGEDPVSTHPTAPLTIRDMRTGDLGSTIEKSFSPESGPFLDADGTPRPVTATLALAATEQDVHDGIVLEDVDPRFWNAVDYRAFERISAGATPINTEAAISVLHGATISADPVLTTTGGTWSEPVVVTVSDDGGVAAGQTFLPEGIAPGDVQGIRVTIRTTDQSPLGHTDGVLGSALDGAGISFVVDPRTQLRSGGANEAGYRPETATNPGETTPGTMTNTATGHILVGDTAGPRDSDDAAYAVTVGTPDLAVAKSVLGGGASTSAPAGSTISYVLDYRNTGDAMLTNPVITDVLPRDAAGVLLQFTPESIEGTRVSVTPENGLHGASAADAVVGINTEGNPAVTFPEGTLVTPGTTISVTMPLVVRAGLSAQDGITNVVQGSADEDVTDSADAVLNVIAGHSLDRRKLVAETVLDSGLTPGGRTPLDTRHNVVSDGVDCADFGDGFYRYPCVVETHPGDLATWKLSVVNTGNVPTNTAEILDIFPYEGDHGIVPSLQEIARDSRWTPEFLGNITVTKLPAGAGYTVRYLTGNPEECRPVEPDAAAGIDWMSGCAEAWTDTLPENPAEVTGLHIVFTFPEVDGDTGGLQPTEAVELTFDTRSARAMPAGVAELSPAWNSMAVYSQAEVRGEVVELLQQPNKTGITFRTLFAVGDVVWIDENRDGVQNDAEILSGVTVALLDAEGQPVRGADGAPLTTVTDGNGRYLFDELPAGDYRVSFTLTPEQATVYTFTAAAAGKDEGADSNADPATGLTPVFTLGVPSATAANMVPADAYSEQSVRAAFVNPTIDAGVVRLPAVQVGDTGWLDENRDGLQSPGEPGIAGVVLVLTGPGGAPVTDVSGAPVAPVETDEDGYYVFPNLPVLANGESYTVTIDRDASAGALRGLTPTIEGAGDDRGADSSTWTTRSSELTANGDEDMTLDFGFVRDATAPSPTPEPTVEPTPDPSPETSGPGNPETGGAPGNGSNSDDTLPSTGADTGSALLLGGLLLGMGALVLFALHGRRQRAGH